MTGTGPRLAGGPPIAGRRRRIARGEFIALLAMSMALGALGIDLMLPAFDAMRADLGLAADSNAIAATITTYFIGLALGTLIYGPLADRFGRRPALFTGFAIYAVGALASALAPSLAVLLLTRFVWGIGAASSRVVAFAIIRDAYEGEEMSRAMSLVMAVFILVPIVAPTIGAGIVAVTSWRWYSERACSRSREWRRGPPGCRRRCTRSTGWTRASAASRGRRGRWCRTGSPWAMRSR